MRTKSITLLFICQLLLGMMCIPAASADTNDGHLLLHYDFTDVSGTEVHDAGSGITAKLAGNASVTSICGRNVLDLGTSNGYLDMTASAGSLVKSLTDFTVSAYYRVDKSASLSGAGYFLWCFSQSAANTETESPYTAYRLNAQRMATSTGGWSGETSLQVGCESAKNKWVHVLYRQQGSNGQLFIDGTLVCQSASMPVLAEVFTASPAYCWIGRAPFSGDNYLRQTLVADFRLYDISLPDTAVSSLAMVAKQMEQEYRYGAAGDFTTLEALIAECRDWMSASSSTAAPNAVAELGDMVTLAEREVAAARAAQVLIDDYCGNLKTLLAKAKATDGFEPKKVFTMREDYGFRHPGGVVSQADIDRAKQLLADGDSRVTSAWNTLCANEYAQSGVATYPTSTVLRGGTGQNYMNAARGAAMAFQNALRWKIGGTKAHADAAVRILMAWCDGCNDVSGDTNMSLAAGIYGYEFANAAELMRDYEGWNATDFDRFRKWMIRVWYNKSIDFLRRRHDTWLNARYADLGERPGHYWSNWGLCNALCLMSIGVLCDDVHIYNQGISFYKYDHVGTYRDRSADSYIMNDGCCEFLGNLVPVVLPDSRGPLGSLGQMQESGRDQGHALMALGLAVDICQMAFNQGDDLYHYMDDRIAAGAEFVAAMNFGNQASTSLPWKPYDYADCRGVLGSAWRQNEPNTGGSGEYRPYWDRLIGYYEGLRGIKMQYTEKASDAICPDGGGGNYGQTSGGFDHLGFSTLTGWRQPVEAADAITPLTGDIIYKGETLKGQTNLGGLKYNYMTCPSKAIPADGAEITLVPQLPDGTEDSGNWKWSNGATTRQITVCADRSNVYRVDYTAANGTVSSQAFAIAVCGDAMPDVVYGSASVDGHAIQDTTLTILCGKEPTLSVSTTTGWTGDYLWDNGTKNSSVTLPPVLSGRTYTCQYANQGGAVSEVRFHINVTQAIQRINGTETAASFVMKGSEVRLELLVPDYANEEEIRWSDGTTGAVYVVSGISDDLTLTASYNSADYVFTVKVKALDSRIYSQILSEENGYEVVTSKESLYALATDHYFVLASDDADLLLGLHDAPNNGNKALFFQSPSSPLTDLSTLFTIELYDGGISLRNVEYDDLMLQTEWDRPDQLRTHDQPLPCEWSRLLPDYADGAWTIENGKYTGNFLGLWNTANGYSDGEEIACNKQGDDIAHLQIFAIAKERFNGDFTLERFDDNTADISVLLENATMTAYTKSGWLRDNNSAAGYSELPTAIQSTEHNGYGISHWRSSAISDSRLIYQTLTGLPQGAYTLNAYAAATVWNDNSGNDNRTGVYLFAEGDGCNEQTLVSTAKYGKYSVNFSLPANGAVTVGLRAGSGNANTWIFLSDVTLLYKGASTDGIEEITGHLNNNSEGGCYDLSGRRVVSPTKGVYIKDNKKIIIR